MTSIHIFLVFVVTVYLIGCWNAYRAVAADRGEYTRWETFKLTLGSWWTVVIGLLGRVQ